MMKFGSSHYEDPTALLSKLPQKSTVLLYQTQFEVLADRTESRKEYLGHIISEGVQADPRRSNVCKIGLYTHYSSHFMVSWASLFTTKISLKIMEE